METPKKPLFEIILETISGMEDVIIKEKYNEEINLKYIRKVGEIIIGYRSEKQQSEVNGMPDTKKTASLHSMDAIRKSLSMYPEIGDPMFYDKTILMYNRELGKAVTKVPGYQPEICDIVDRVLVVEKPLFSVIVEIPGKMSYR